MEINLITMILFGILALSGFCWEWLQETEHTHESRVEGSNLNDN